MAREAPPFAGSASPPPAAVAAVAALGAAELVSGALRSGGPDAAAKLLAAPHAAAAAAILAGSAAPLAFALVVALASARAVSAPVRDVLRMQPRGRRGPGEAAAFFLIGAFVAAPAAAVLSVPVVRALGFFGFEAGPQPFLEWFSSPEAGFAVKAAVALSVVCIAPVAEEILYRAVLWQGSCAWLARRSSGRRSARAEAAAAAACAAFFAALHLSAAAFVPVFAFALVLSRVYRRGSLGRAVALHAGFNAGGCAIALALA